MSPIPGFWSHLFGGHTSDAGEIVNERTALSISTVFACVRVLSESVASLPLKLYRRTEQGRIQATDQRLHYLLSVAPNAEMGAFSFFEVMVTSMALCGNAYASIERTGDGEVVGLWPLNPNNTTPIRINGQLAYRTTDGEIAGSSRIITASDMIHAPMFPGYDGIVGLSPLQLHRQTFGHTRAAEKFGARWFANYSTPSLALKTDKSVPPEMKNRMRAEWEAMQSGSNSFRTAVLDGGLEIERLGLSPEEGQYLETRRFLREEIAAIYRVPAHMVGDNTKLANASVEGQNVDFCVSTLRPYCNRIEQAISRKLLPSLLGQEMQYVVEFDTSERRRGDLTAQTNYFRTAIQFGWMSPNEVRREINLNEGPASLNVYQAPVNMMNSDRLLDPKLISPALPASSETENMNE